jgi:hypothetical protein
MYSNKMVCCLKAKGKVLREFKDEVQIPFGQEYSILLKNLNTVRASVNVTIDGVDVVGGSLVIRPNSEIELERFIANGNMKQGNRFKFIERTSGIENHRGVKIEDGIVRIEFKYEKLVPAFNITPYNPPLIWNNTSNQITRGMPGPLGVSAGWGGPSDAYATTISSNAAPQSATYSAGITASAYIATSVNNVGITAPGSISSQEFTQGAWFPTENESHVIVLKLVGVTALGKPILEPVTVKARPVCTMCGVTAKKAMSKFCDECGTSVTIV